MKVSRMMINGGVWALSGLLLRPPLIPMTSYMSLGVDDVATLDNGECLLKTLKESRKMSVKGNESNK